MEGKKKTTLDIGLEHFFKIVSKKCKRGVTRKFIDGHMKLKNVWILSLWKCLREKTIFWLN